MDAAALGRHGIVAGLVDRFSPAGPRGRESAGPPVRGARVRVRVRIRVRVRVRVRIRVRVRVRIRVRVRVRVRILTSKK